MILPEAYATLKSPKAMETGFRQLPSVDKLLSDERLRMLESDYSRSLVLSATRETLEEFREAIAQGNPPPTVAGLVDAVIERAKAIGDASLVPVINATGVILHTNLGRAPLSDETLAAMELASRGYNNLEYDLATGKRGSRQDHIESLLCRLTGAEAALVVNNNASGVLLGLTALARRREVITSRGQAVEIGGSFRIPDVMRQSGAKLVEVGTTNCTYSRDYEQAITPRTAALLRVHSSNFKIVGFTQEVALEELSILAREHGLLLLDDLGSGCLLDTAKYGLAYEPTAQESVAAGVDLAFFSGDKLLGGPQAGLILGKKDPIAKLRKHPLARAVRIDKVRLAGLAATLLHYLKDEAEAKIPIWQMISLSLIEVERRARAWSSQLDGMATVVQGESVVGGGSLPGSTLPTRLLAIKAPEKGRDRGAVQRMARELRLHRPAVIGRIEGHALLLDPRTVPCEDDLVVIAALRQAVRVHLLS